MNDQGAESYALSCNDEKDQDRRWTWHNQRQHVHSQQQQQQQQRKPLYSTHSLDCKLTFTCSLYLGIALSYNY
jgi:hypothetical protein